MASRSDPMESLPKVNESPVIKLLFSSDGRGDFPLSDAFDSFVKNIAMFDRGCKRKGRSSNNLAVISSNLRFARIGGGNGIESLNAELVEVLPLISHQNKNDSHEDTRGSYVSQPTEPLVQNVLKSALAGGIACSFSAFVMHPVDTIKTCVQATTLSFPELVSKIPEFGLRGMYKGSIPAVGGQFASHGLRTGLCELTKFILMKAAPALPEIQVQTLASLCSSILGTTARVPCEVLKQRLQAGIFDNVGEAAVVTWRQDGMKGLFRGTGATLCRELPFYVFGAGLYEEAKKGVQKLLKRELQPWETVLVGAVTGGLASVLTTPFDVFKTRMMTAPQGVQVTMQMAALTILHEDGPLGLFRGAMPRFFWVAPLGAMNFAGYELLRKAMDRAEFLAGYKRKKKKMTAEAE